MGKVVMYSSVSVDGFIADENDQPGPLFDWLSSGDVPLDESGELPTALNRLERRMDLRWTPEIGVHVSCSTNPNFLEALGGFLLPDAASQGGARSSRAVFERCLFPERIRSVSAVVVRTRLA